MNDLLIAAVGAIVSAVVAYPLGRVQGKQQTVFEEQAKIMAELRRRLMAADKALAFASAFADEDDPRYRDELLEQVGSLGDYYQDNNVWLERRLKEKIARIVRGYDDQAQALITGHQDILAPRQYQGMTPEEVHEEVLEWYLGEGQALAEDLEAEARKLLGVDRPWWRRWFGE
jgi:hypothetical protein